MSFVDPSGLKIYANDEKAKKILSALRGGKLTQSQQSLIDLLDKDGFDVNISTGNKKVGQIATTSKCENGANVGFQHTSENDLFNAGVLLHELVHARQIKQGILPGLPTSEAEGYKYFDDFIDQNGLGIKK